MVEAWCSSDMEDVIPVFSLTEMKSATAPTLEWLTFWLVCALCSISALICVATVGWLIMWVLAYDLFHCYLSHQPNVILVGTVIQLSLWSLFLNDLPVALFAVFLLSGICCVVVNWFLCMGMFTVWNWNGWFAVCTLLLYQNAMKAVYFSVLKYVSRYQLYNVVLCWTN